MLLTLAKCKSLSFIIIGLLIGLVLSPNTSHSALRFDTIDVSDGLSQTTVRAVTQDHQGIMWFGTDGGLNRFDGTRIQAFTHQQGQPNSLSSNRIVAIQPSQAGELWIATADGGMNLWLPGNMGFSSFQNSLADVIHALAAAPDGNFWLATQDHGLVIFDPQHKTYQLAGIQPRQLLKNNNYQITSLAFDQHGQLWIGTLSSGFSMLDMSTGEHTVFDDAGRPSSSWGSSYVRDIFVHKNHCVWISTFTNGLYQLSRANSGYRPARFLIEHEINSVAFDHLGRLWIGSYQDGLFRYDPDSSEIQQYLFNARHPEGLSSNIVFDLFHDSSNQLWLGTDAGVARLNIDAELFGYGNPHLSNSTELNQRYIADVEADQNGNLWFATLGGGLVQLDQASNRYTTYLHADNENSLVDNDVYSLAADTEGLWIGTSEGLDYLNLSSMLFTHYRTIKDNGPLANGTITSLYIDSADNVWIGTHLAGAYVRPAGTQNFIHYPRATTTQAGLNDQYVNKFFEHSDGEIWILTPQGVNRVRLKGSKVELIHSSKANNKINSLWESTNGQVWQGGRNGLQALDNQLIEQFTFDVSDGLSNNTITCILEDDRSNLWVSTLNGLNRYNIDNRSVSSFFERDGLQSNEFNLNCEKLADGRLVFIGINGYNLFDPDKINIDITLAQPLISGVSLIGPASSNTHSDGLVTTSDKLGRIELDHQHYGLDIHYASLHYKAPDKNQSRYMLEGLDKNWFYSQGAENSVRYTNLAPANYTFKVEAANSNGIWNPVAASITLQVLPPWWKTGWAYTGYALVMLLSGFIVIQWRTYKLRQYNEKLRNDVNARTHDIAEQKAIIEAQVEELKSLDKAKEQFFENISHEFRTPLTLILGNFKRLLPNQPLADFQRYRDIAIRNAARLLRLINKLLEVSRLESGMRTIKPAVYPINHQIRQVTENFQTAIADKQLTLKLDLHDNLLLYYDAIAMEEILVNLVSNAVKFTPAQGVITIFTGYHNDEQVSIKVSNTGPGITADELPHIFDRFHRSADNRHGTGTGIGLALVSELTRIQGGTVTVDSKPRQGCSFNLTFPMSMPEADVTSLADSEHLTAAQLERLSLSVASPKPAVGITAWDETRPILLIIDDEPDMRAYLSDILQEYELLTAADGKAGLRMALEHLPDLILSDIMMPELDGLELSRLLRDNARTCHTPIILLTAKGGRDSKLTGLSKGVDDYIVKPFDEQELLIKINNLLAIRDTYAKQYGALPYRGEDNPGIPIAERRFLQQLNEVLSENYANADFSINALASKMTMSERQLQRKLKAAFDQTPIEYLRYYRLQQAQRLLKLGHSVSHTYEASGFASMAHFSRCYKAFFGDPPSQHQNSRKHS